MTRVGSVALSYSASVGEPDAQCHRLTSTMPKYGNSGTERSPHARSAFPRALGYPGSAPRGPRTMDAEPDTNELSWHEMGGSEAEKR